MKCVLIIGSILYVIKPYYDAKHLLKITSRASYFVVFFAFTVS